MYRGLLVFSFFLYFKNFYEFIVICYFIGKEFSVVVVYLGLIRWFFSMFFKYSF